MRRVFFIASLTLVGLAWCAVKASADEPATCPVILGTPRLEGVSSAGAQRAYRADLKAPSGVRLTLRLIDAAGGALGDLTTDATPTETDALMHAASLSIWTSRPLGSVAVRSVLGADGSTTPCSLAPREVDDRGSGASTIAIYQQPRRLQDGAALTLAPIVDAAIARKAMPMYPVAAKQQGLVGKVEVEVTVGPDGRATHVGLWQSSDVEMLDASAMHAAQQTTFNPPYQDGVPTSRNYLIEYIFKLGETSPPATDCEGVELGNITRRLVPDLPQHALFRVSFRSSAAKIASLRLAFYNDDLLRKASFAIPIDDFRSDQAVISGPADSGTGHFLFGGADADYVGLESVEFADGHRTECPPIPVHVLDGNGARVPVPPVAPMQGATAFPVFAARFATRVFPAYPAVAPSSGTVTVLVEVGANGVPRSAMAVSGPLDVAFSKAATAAPMASRYRVSAESGAGYVYESFEFVGTPVTRASP